MSRLPSGYNGGRCGFTESMSKNCSASEVSRDTMTKLRDRFTRFASLSISGSVFLILAGTGPAGARAAAPIALEEKKIPPAAEGPVDYQKDIEPILQKNCHKCHGPEKQKSKFRLDTRELLLKGGENGKAVVEGKSAESPLVRYISGVDPEIKMPSDGDPLSPKEIGLIRAWIDQGLKWSEKAGPEKPKGPKLGGLKGQTSWVTSLAYDSKGKVLATAGGNTLVIKPGEVKLWDGVTLEPRAALVGHEKTVWSVAFDKEGQRLATGGYDKLVKVWDVASGKEKLSLPGHSNWVTCVAFSPKGSLLASGSEDTTIKLWDTEKGKEEKTLKGHTGTVRSLSFSSDGRFLASGSFDQTVKLWDVAKGTEVSTLKAHTDGVWSVAFSPDGATLASGSADGTVRLWALAEKNEGLAATEREPLKGHRNWVSCVAFSPDGKKLASGSFDDTVRVWDVSTGLEIGLLPDLRSTVWSLTFTTDGKSLALGFGASSGEEETVKFWKLPAREHRF
jgi:WD40 repeat protein